MDEALAHKLFGDWSEDHWHLAVFINADFAPDDEAEAWVEELLAGALAAMANAGLAVTRTPLRTDDGKIFVTLDGQELMARDLDNESADLAVEHLFGRLDAIAAAQDRRERWNLWYTGDPVGAAFFVTPEELITSAGIDVRDLNTGEYWFRVSEN